MRATVLCPVGITVSMTFSQTHTLHMYPHRVGPAPPCTEADSLDEFERLSSQIPQGPRPTP